MGAREDAIRDALMGRLGRIAGTALRGGLLMSILARLGARANWHRLEQGFIADL